MAEEKPRTAWGIFTDTLFTAMFTPLVIVGMAVVGGAAGWLIVGIVWLVDKVADVVAACTTIDTHYICLLERPTSLILAWTIIAFVVVGIAFVVEMWKGVIARWKPAEPKAKPPVIGE